MVRTDGETAKSLQIIVPCYNEEDALPATIDSLYSLLREMQAQLLINDQSSTIFVDDGSRDRTWEIISEWSQKHRNVIGLRLARNAGHQNALLAGLEYSTADLTLSIDADLQDDLTVIPDMIRKADMGYDVIFGVREDRSSDSRFKRFTAESYYALLSLLGVDVVINHADFRLMSRDAVGRLLQFNESNLYLRGIVPLVGHKTDSVYYRRHARASGETKYPLRKMIALATNGVTSFSAVPLRMIAGLGFIVFLLSFAMGAWVLWVRLFTESAVPGWASTLLPTFFLGGVQLLSLGVIGEYIAKIYIESKRRPRYFVEQVSKID